MRMAQPGVPTVECWLAETLPQGGTLAADGFLRKRRYGENAARGFFEEKRHLPAG